MKEYEVVVVAYQTVRVSAEDSMFATIKALDSVEVGDWEDPEIYGVRCLSNCDKDYCLNCMNCGTIDDEFRLITCNIDHVPNGHKINHCCCLYEKGEVGV